MSPEKKPSRLPHDCTGNQLYMFTQDQLFGFKKASEANMALPLFRDVILTVKPIFICNHINMLERLTKRQFNNIFQQPRAHISISLLSNL